MELSRDDIKAILEYREGRRNKPYYDTLGVPTIGVGRNLNNGLRDDEIDLMLDNDYEQAAMDVQRWLGSEIAGSIRENYPVRWAMLVDLSFQLGLDRLRKFIKTRYHLMTFSFSDAATEMLDSLWAQQTPSRAKSVSSGIRNNKLSPYLVAAVEKSRGK